MLRLHSGVISHPSIEIRADPLRMTLADILCEVWNCQWVTQIDLLVFPLVSLD
ncbi:MAG: hypothetical protein H6Q41_1750 [Deltaproteobacteria bacterium]|nr:hypothetical protein [Deltaproteobacteria bacterium]